MPGSDGQTGGDPHERGFGYIELLLASLLLALVALLTANGGVEVWTPVLAPPEVREDPSTLSINPMYVLSAFGTGFLVDGVMRLRWKPIDAYVFRSA